MSRRRVAHAPSDARGVALEVLLRVEAEAAFADVLLGRRLAAAGLTPRDAALATRLVYGTLAWQGRLDHHLRGLAARDVAGLEPPVRGVLRLGLYQLQRLARIPPYAVVDSSVRLARRVAPPAAGLVNAVLRRAAADPTSLALPPIEDPVGRMAIEWSHPRWLVERWAREFDREELPALLAANNERGRTAIRVNRLRADREALAAELHDAGVTTETARWAPDALVIDRAAARLRELPAFAEGRLAFQGEASQLVAELVGAPACSRILDACASPGGKATYLAERMGRGGIVVAIDTGSGIRRVRDEAHRLGIASLLVARGDAREPPAHPPFDAVLVDAPCSGLGTLRRHPEVRWRRTAADIPRLASLQRQILDGAAPLVRRGGTVVYAVCTLARDENEDVVASFLAGHPDFRIDPAGQHLPPEAASLVTRDGWLRTLPHRDALDGFFAARLRRMT